MKKRKTLSILYIVLCFIFFYTPIVVMIIFSFNSSKSLTGMTGFSLRWYERLINDSSILKAVYVSLSIALFSTLISTVMGTLTSIGLSKNGKKFKKILLGINDIPIMNPDIVTAIGLMILFSSAMLERGYFTMLLSHVLFCTPFVITSVYPKVRNMDPAVADAALDLGATPFETLVKVIIPMLKDGIYAGALLAFTMSFDDFVVSYFVTGKGVQNISIVVYNMTKRTNPTINALSTVVILVIVILLVVSKILPVIVKNILRRFIWIFIILLVGLTVLLGIRSNKKTLRVFNSGEYYDPELIERFEEENDCQIVYETFDSNESMYTKLQSGAEYDVLITSDYMIERLVKEDYLMPVDWSLITNKDTLAENSMGLSYDPDNTYSVPYYYGTVGIVYNVNEVDEEDINEGWNILKNDKYRGDIYMLDSERDSFMVALKALGYSMNTTNEDEIREAYEWLVDQKKNMDVVYAGDDVMDNMISNNKAMAVVYSGDGAYVMAENDELGYFDPQQGTNEWVDAMVITNDCENTALAHKFIDYTLEYDVEEQNTYFIGYTPCVEQVAKDLAETEYEGINAFTPEFGGKLNEVFEYQEADIRQLYADLWTKIKSY